MPCLLSVFGRRPRRSGGSVCVSIRFTLLASTCGLVTTPIVRFATPPSPSRQTAKHDSSVRNNSDLQQGLPDASSMIKKAHKKRKKENEEEYSRKNISVESLVAVYVIRNFSKERETQNQRLWGRKRTSIIVAIEDTNLLKEKTIYSYIRVEGS
ncbi:hypothetical protein K1719_032898 [Acacia pycnantha]|nr:hypothetical protein K1719_032898 [Acacia pycnantha]